MDEKLTTAFGTITVDQLCLMHRARQINLTPGFQRNTVWTLSDRQRLIESIVNGYPLPSIFLYKRQEEGSARSIHDVIDGKQRIETLFMFMGEPGFGKDRFEVRLDLGDGFRSWSWKSIQRKHPRLANSLLNFTLQRIEVSGEFARIVDLFVRINSTGKKLTSGEKRHARFYQSAFLRQAEKLTTKHESFLRENKVLTTGQLDRMKGHELMAELLMSIRKGGPINKKSALDKAIGNESVNAAALQKSVVELNRTFALIKRIFPKLKETRFSNISDFYTLFMVLWELDREGFVLNNKTRNEMAFGLLRRLSNGVGSLYENTRKAQPLKEVNSLYQTYLMTVRGSTDSQASRERRADIVRGVLKPLFERKDENRVFSLEQRRLIWNSEAKVVCGKCRKPITWNDLSIDHILPHSRGGRTALTNAQPMHKRCNSSKGAR